MRYTHHIALFALAIASVFGASNASGPTSNDEVLLSRKRHKVANASQDHINHDHAEPLRTRAVESRPPAMMVLRGAIEPNGGERTFTGTIQEIDAQIHSIKPDFSRADFQPSPAEGRTVRPRGRRNINRVQCPDPSLSPAPRAAVAAAQSWLVSIATPLSAPGQQCAQVSCAGGAAVWLCNDNLGGAQASSLAIANAVGAILGDRRCDAANGTDGPVRGQAFDSASYHVVVNGDAACAGDGV
ncbi:hypothetical protein GGS23DRAFT_599704 [Durotheca rogersii]|uniref:uncharacterized protein n=1 Tax=Durotheca rogersii TaxID=419775 RepID=UPI00221EF4FD|nr:uncharacterized protein GGS23DRAFT_599704 [Durotheca rogersii]KAI5860043.1 hypothetical protein GGS23DRAFT_599704 [Durotheca rogersii]